MSNFMPHHAYESYGDPKKANKTSNALDLLKYDLVYFIIHKHLATGFAHQEMLRYDRGKQRHYLKGRIVEIPGINPYKAFVVLDQKKFAEFKAEKKAELKRKMVNVIFFTYIEAVVLKMEHLDYV